MLTSLYVHVRLRQPETAVVPRGEPSSISSLQGECGPFAPSPNRTRFTQWLMAIGRDLG